ncbi:MAG: hypothetical protein ABR502_09890 [Chitinophagaceae bacterium]
MVLVFTSCKKEKQTQPKPELPTLSQPLPLGNFIANTETDATCPAGYTCYGFEIQVPGVTKNERGFLAVAPYRGTPRGVIMFFTGGGGDEWWTRGSATFQMADELRSLGFSIVQVRWNINWLISSPGNDAGTAHLAARPATVIKYVYDKFYVPLGIPKQTGKAGFCITGNSGGSTQVSYALSHYGLENIIDVAIPTGGPPHSVLSKSCMNRPGEEAYWFAADTRNFIDQGFGFFDGNGPAARSDASFVSRWLAESVATGGSDYNHPGTRIHFLLGQTDTPMQVIATDYFNRLNTDGTPFLTWEIVSNTGHAIHGSQEGRAALKAAILK